MKRPRKRSSICYLIIRFRRFIATTRLIKYFTGVKPRIFTVNLLTCTRWSNYEKSFFAENCPIQSEANQQETFNFNIWKPSYRDKLKHRTPDDRVSQWRLDRRINDSAPPPSPRFLRVSYLVFSNPIISEKFNEARRKIWGHEEGG